MARRARAGFKICFDSRAEWLPNLDQQKHLEARDGCNTGFQGLAFSGGFLI
jgi:hypothetical protein